MKINFINCEPFSGGLSLLMSEMGFCAENDGDFSVEYQKKQRRYS